MSVQFIEGPVGNFVPGAALAKYRRVKLSAGKLAYAGSTDVSLGTIEEDSFDDSSPPVSPVRFRNAAGTRVGIASEAITAGNQVYAGANGKFAATGTIIEGRALTGTTADGDQFEVEVYGDPSDPTAGGWMGTAAAVTAAGSAQGDAAALTNGVLNVVTGADNAKGVVLPAAAAGKILRVQNSGTASLKVYPASSDTINGGTADVAVTIPARGVVLFECYDATDWAALGNLTFSQSLTPDDAEGTGNSILAHVSNVTVGTVTNDANDFIVLPAIASVPIGHTIRIGCNAGGNFELRTPASSNTKINDVDSDGTQEYLCTNTELVTVVKHTATSWVAYGHSKLGAAVAAVVPD